MIRAVVVTAIAIGISTHAQAQVAACPTAGPIQLAPDSRVPIAPGQIILTWSPIPGATYDVLGTLDDAITAPIKLNSVPLLTPSFIYPLGAGHKLQWQVVAHVAGCADVTSAKAVFQTICPPGPATLAPAPAATLLGGQITLSWAAVTGASAYDVFVGLDSVIPTPITPAGGIPTTSTVVNVGAGHSVEWYVRANVPPLCTPEGAHSTFSTAPSCPTAGPTLLSPPNSLLPAQTAGPVTFSWSPVSGASTYQLFTIIDGAATPTPQAITPTTTQTVPIDGAHKVEWYVTAFLTGTACPPVSSSHFTFQTQVACPTATPALVSPPAGASFDQGIPILFTWSAVPGATSYDVVTLTAAGGPGATLASAPAGATAATATPAIGSYTWAVRANVAAGCQPLVSTSRTFDVHAPAPICTNTTAPTIIGPVAGKSFDLGTPVTFTWSPVTGATGYDIVVSAGAAAPSTILVSAAADATTATATPPAAGIYIWVVRAKFAAGCQSLDSAPSNFRVDATTPCPTLVATPLAPANNSTVTLPVTFDWDDVPGATGYNVFTVTAGNPTPALLGSTTVSQLTNQTLPAGTYQWFVETIFGAGCSSKSSRSSFIVPPTANCPTGTATLIAPATGAADVKNPVTFDWSDVSGASGYRLFVSINGGTPTAIGTPTASQFITDLPNGTVDWYVETLFDSCPSTQSAHSRFTTSDAGGCPSNPQTPQTLAPANGASVTSPVTFQWTSVPSATGYRVVATLNGGSAFDVGTTASTQLTATIPQGSISWAVVAAFGSDCPTTTVSNRSTFTVTSATDCGGNKPVSLTSPGNNASMTSPVTFSWSPATGASLYKLFASRNGGSFDLLGTTTDTQLLRVMQSGQFDWYVETDFPACASLKSQTLRFTVSEAVSCPDASITLASPANGATTTSPVTFSWSAVTGASKYRLWVSVDGGTPDVLTKIDTTTTQPLSIASGAIEWYVEALRDKCPSVLSARGHFTVQKSANCGNNTAPTLVSPVGTASNPATTGLSVQFKWNGANGAKSYRVWVATSGQPFSDVATTQDTQITRELTAGTYSWFVEALFDACPSLKSSAAAFTVASSTPACSNANPTIVSPADGAPNVASPVTFLWSSVPGADDYRVFATVDDGPLTLVGETHDTSISRPMPPGNVTWVVEATFEHCPATRSASARFSVPRASVCSGESAQLTGPSDGAANVQNPVTFSWNDVSGSTGYVLWVKAGDDTAAAIAQTSGTTLSKHLPEGPIEWWVVTFGAGCAPSESKHSRFNIATTQCENKRPMLISPADDLEVSSPVTLVWTPVSGATSYKVWTVERDGDSLIATTTATTATVTLPAGMTHWFVEAEFSSCSPTQSATSDFRVLPAPPTCTTPSKPTAKIAGEVETDTAYNVHWTAVPNVDKYELQESTTLDFNAATTIVVSGVAWPTKHTATAAPVQYLYRVRAISPCNDERGPYSDVVGIFIIPPKPDPSQQHASAEIGTLSTVVQTIFIPGPSTPTNFSAKPDKPWLTVTPSTGTIPPAGITLTVTADPSVLALGTNTGTILLSYSTSAAGSRATTMGSTPVSTVPVSVSLVTPVAPGGKNTPLPESLFIPAVGHAAGANNSLFETDVRVANLSPQTMKYLANFTPSGTNGTVTGSSMNIQIDPGTTMALDDILAKFFGAAAAGGSALGTLELRPLTSTAATSALSPVSPAGGVQLVTVASSRTYNATPNGTYGQFVPAIPFANFIGSAGNAVLSFQQVAQSAAYRTNFGIVEGAGEPAAVLLTVFDGKGNKIADIPINDIQPGEHRQINSILAANNITLDDGRIELKVTSATGRVTAYASVIDNRTNDPLMVFPVVKSSISSSRYVLPGIGDFDIGFAHWKSDVRIFNSGSTAANVTLSYYPQGDPGHPKTTTVTLNAGEVKALDNFIQTTFPSTQTAGSLVLTTPTSSSLIATARTYTDTGNGTFGQFIAGVAPADAVGLGGRALQILQLEESTRMRTNIALAETTGNPATVQVAVILPDSRTTPVANISLAANEFRQIPLASLGLTNVYNARVTVKVTDGAGKVTAAGSVIDNATQDPTFVPAQ